MVKREATKCFPAWRIFIQMKELVHAVNNDKSKCSSFHDDYIDIALVSVLRAPNISVTGLVFRILLLFWNACWELPRSHIKYLSEYEV